MTSFDKQRIIEVVLYILNKTGGIDYYHLFKIFYFVFIAIYFLNFKYKNHLKNNFKTEKPGRHYSLPGFSVLFSAYFYFKHPFPW